MIKDNRLWGPEELVLPVVAVIGAVGWPVNAAFSGECLMRASLGVPCPLCGCSRAAQRLFAGDIIGALRWSVPAVALIVVLFAGCVLFAWRLARPRAPNRVAARILCCFAVVFAFGNWAVQVAKP